MSTVVSPTGGSFDLVEQLASFPHKDFPRGYDYNTQFQNLQNHLNEYYHKHVTSAASLSDGDGFLTDHGVEHIKTVIRRASRLLVTSTGGRPTAYETYIFLAAAHLHDLGNFFGREAHELNAQVVMNELGPLLGEDAAEKLIIQEIAQAHGGSLDGNKDKIGQLRASDHIFSEPLRPQFLAALLRFADELADDSSRASRYMVEKNIVPESSMIYHRYATALRSVAVDADAVSLKFYLDEKDIRQKFGKGKGKAFLIDEIYARTMKMHRERIYCMRFLRPAINVNRIDVSVELFSSGFVKKLSSIEYRLQEAGYPDEDSPTIFELCPQLLKKTGDMVKARFDKKKGSATPKGKKK